MATNVRELAACPEGQLGVAAADLMAQINTGMYQRAIELLPPAVENPHGRMPVLEVGYGAGAMRGMLQQARPDIRWVGLEKSRTMHRIAQQLQTYEVHHGAVECLPFEDERFVSVIALNTLCWWDYPMVALAEIRRVLVPTGTLIVSILLPNAQAKALESQAPPAPVYYTPLQLRRMLGAAGFRTYQSLEDTETVQVGEHTTSRAYQLVSAARGPR